MPHTARHKCVECEKNFESHQVGEVGDGLLRLFLAIRLSKRIDYFDSICQKCRCHFVHWQRQIEGNFDEYTFNRSNVNSSVNNGDSVRFHYSLRNGLYFSKVGR